MFVQHAPRIRTFSKTTNMTTFILLAVTFHIHGCEDILTKMYIILGL